MMGVYSYLLSMTITPAPFVSMREVISNEVVAAAVQILLFGDAVRL